MPTGRSIRVSADCECRLSGIEGENISRKPNLRVVFVLALVISLVTGPSFAEESGDVHPALTDVFSVDLGAYFPDRELRLRVDGSTDRPGDLIDFQTDFNDTRSDDIIALNVGWRFGEKWQFRGQYFHSEGRRDAVLVRDIQWGDSFFGAGSSVSAGQEFSLTRFFFARDFATGKHHEFGLGVGIHWLDLGAFISGNIIDENGEPGAVQTESVGGSAPLPNIGARYLASISPNWAFSARLDWLSASVGDYDGRLINASLGINYRLFRNAGAGISYNFFSLDVDVRKSDWRGRWDNVYRGPYAYFSFYW